MTNHSFWGDIRLYAGHYTAGITFSHPFFGNNNIEILLAPGIENTQPDEALLFEYASTYAHFINNIGNRLLALQQTMFEVYVKYLKENNDNLVDTIEQHNDYIKDLAFIRISTGDTVEFCFYYSLVNAPVHSVTFIGNQVYGAYDEP